MEHQVTLSRDPLSKVGIPTEIPVVMSGPHCSNESVPHTAINTIVLYGKLLVFFLASNLPLYCILSLFGI